MCRFHSKHVALRTYLYYRAQRALLDQYKIADMTGRRNQGIPGECFWGSLPFCNLGYSIIEMGEGRLCVRLYM